LIVLGNFKDTTSGKNFGIHDTSEQFTGRLNRRQRWTAPKGKYVICTGFHENPKEKMIYKRGRSKQFCFSLDKEPKPWPLRTNSSILNWRVSQEFVTDNKVYNNTISTNWQEKLSFSKWQVSSSERGSGTEVRKTSFPFIFITM
jgi:hypothetical protein